MNKDLSYQVKAAQKLLTKAGLSFRLATMQEKRDAARAYKKKDYLPWGVYVRKGLRDARDHFKKDVWVVFSGALLIGFWSSRRLIKYAREHGKGRRDDALSERHMEPARDLKYRNSNQIVIEPPLEDTDAAGWYPDEHFCKNCPEYVLWEEYKAQNRLTNE
jgi:hypothetical protein